MAHRLTTSHKLRSGRCVPGFAITYRHRFLVEHVLFSMCGSLRARTPPSPRTFYWLNEISVDTLGSYGLYCDSDLGRRDDLCTSLQGEKDRSRLASLLKAHEGGSRSPPESATVSAICLCSIILTRSKWLEAPIVLTIRSVVEPWKHGPTRRCACR